MNLDLVGSCSDDRDQLFQLATRCQIAVLLQGREQLLITQDYELVESKFRTDVELGCRLELLSRERRPNLT